MVLQAFQFVPQRAPGLLADGAAHAAVAAGTPHSACGHQRIAWLRGLDGDGGKVSGHGVLLLVKIETARVAIATRAVFGDSDDGRSA
jgi:hypothetical protein